MAVFIFSLWRLRWLLSRGYVLTTLTGLVIFATGAHWIRQETGIAAWLTEWPRSRLQGTPTTIGEPAGRRKMEPNGLQTRVGPLVARDDELSASTPLPRLAPIPPIKPERSAAAEALGQKLSIQSVENSEARIPNEKIVFLIQGEITPGDYDRVKHAIGDRQRPFIVLDSPGGSLEDAFQIARFLRSRQATTFVPDWGFCASSCVTVFVGGIERIAAPQGRLAVHRFALTPETAAQFDENLDAQSIAAIAQEITAKAISFYSEMGVDTYVLTKMMTTPNDSIHFFSSRELTKYNIVSKNRKDKNQLKSISFLAKKISNH